MSSLRQNNYITSVILSDVAKLTSALPTVGTTVSDANLEQGAVVFVNAGMQRSTLASLATGDRFMIVQGKGVGKNLMKSPVMTVGKTKITTSKHKPTVQQITTIGFNGTTGSLPVANNTDFWIKIRKNDNDAANRSQPMSLFAGPVKTDSTGTQAELASLLAFSGNKNFFNEPANKYISFEVLSSDAGAAVGAAADTVIGTIGQRTVVITDTGANSSVIPIAVGDYFRVGTATTAAVYKVTASTVGVTGGTLTLDRPLLASISLLGTTAEFIAAANAATANFGIRITGIQGAFDVNRFRNFYANRFTATFSDDSTLVTHVQGAYNGNGVWQQVAMDEYMSYGFEGQNDMIGVPPSFRDQEVKIPGSGVNTALSSKYSAINISWEESIPGLVSLDSGRGNVLIYLNLLDSSGLGILDTSPDNTGETLATALGLTASTLNE